MLQIGILSQKFVYFFYKFTGLLSYAYNDVSDYFFIIISKTFLLKNHLIPLVVNALNLLLLTLFAYFFYISKTISE